MLVRSIVVIVSAVALQGCAMSSRGLSESKLDASYASAKAPGDVALCIQEIMRGGTQLVQVSPEHYVVTRNSMYQIPMARWDVRKTASGSAIEFRKSMGVMVGQDKATTCF